MQKIRLYSILLSFTCLAFGIGLLVLLNSLGPDRNGNILLFYFLFAVAIFSLATLVGFYLRKIFGQRELLNQYYRVAARQGLLFTLLLTISLFLLSHGLFSWFNGSFLVLTLVFLESYLLTQTTNDRKP